MDSGVREEDLETFSKDMLEFWRQGWRAQNI